MYSSRLTLVTWPVYDSARVSSLSKRTAAGQRAHEESRRLINEWDRERIQREALQRAR